MIKKKKTLLIVCTIFLLYFILWVNNLIPQSPKPFLSNKEVMKEIAREYPEYDVKKIQDRVFIDKKHVFVPYLSKENDYGIINWSWNNNEWEIASIEINMFDPKLWKIKSNGSFKYYLLWNMPTSQVHKINFYLTKERQFSFSEGVWKYEPKIQMKSEKMLNGSSYGLYRFPKKWERIMNDETYINSSNQSDSLFSSFEQPTSMMVLWLPLDKNNKITKLIYPVEGGRGSGVGNSQINFIQDAMEENLEGEHILFPKQK
ncbi:hypothetical protein J5Y03_17430 [Bacillus sp. RG28]|uniref:Uncharacterized protein n=1 Tax=Gottfriedia endophytica TaxID=2820819 RepID=A0A940NXN3_9BACI|nr:hypothetical protein [Gottfriedia endophytica]MBP0726943.1 hypothetical protein [Gottfriedia endophytica]